jgi:carboxyl-terminal processing protease
MCWKGVILFFVSLSPVVPSAAQFSQDASSTPALAYFKKVVDNIRADYYFIDKINLDSISSSMMPLVRKASTIEDTYSAVRQLLEQLYEHHSGFLSPDESFKLLNDTSEILYPGGRILPDLIAYLKIPHYTSSELKMQDWADSLKRMILRFKANGVSGWIIDLRGNYGGSHLPMIEGLAPLLGEGFIFSEANNKGETDSSFILKGVYVRKSKGILVYKFPSSGKQQFGTALLPLAVLIDKHTASGGEITAISLVRCKGMKLFGEKSAGYPTLNKVFLMPDNSLLYLVHKLIRDANGRIHTDSLVPDFSVTQKENGKTDETVNTAIKWIMEN